ncbi:DNA-binding phage protein [Rhodoblastus sphagnicola]|nr:DNA-binding phage protein [Rhodoblastus sphagnicola]
MIDETAIRLRFEALRPSLDERGRRLFAAVEARAAGVGGVAAVSRATGVVRSTIQRGLKELDAPPMTGRVRRAGGGRLPLTRKDPTLLEDLRRLLEPATVGDPMRPLLWVSKSCALSTSRMIRSIRNGITSLPRARTWRRKCSVYFVVSP